MKVARRVLRGPRRSNAPGLPDGATADRVFALGDDGDLDQQAAYTALSRGRVENRLYMLEPDQDLQALLEPNPRGAQRPQGRELLLEHAERELSRDRSQHLATDHLDPLAAELLANLPEPEGQPVGHSVDDLLDQLPEPVGPRAHSPLADDLLDQLPEPLVPRGHSSLADDLLAELPDPVDAEPDLADQVAKITTCLDVLERPQPSITDDYGIAL